jgi:hypothetical protein
MSYQSTVLLKISLEMENSVGSIYCSFYYTQYGGVEALPKLPYKIPKDFPDHCTATLHFQFPINKIICWRGGGGVGGLYDTMIYLKVPFILPDHTTPPTPPPCTSPKENLKTNSGLGQPIIIVGVA